jgi:hypothetical protein
VTDLSDSIMKFLLLAIIVAAFSSSSYAGKPVYVYVKPFFTLTVLPVFKTNMEIVINATRADGTDLTLNPADI